MKVMNTSPNLNDYAALMIESSEDLDDVFQDLYPGLMWEEHIVE